MAEMIVKKRPKHLDLMNIHLPLAGKVSILHRVSGAGLFLLAPVLLALFAMSLASEESYAQLQSCVAHPFSKLILAGLIWAFWHHFCTGIRFLLLDLHIGLSKESATLSSVAVLVCSLLLTAVSIVGVLL